MKVEEDSWDDRSMYRTAGRGWQGSPDTDCVISVAHPTVTG